MSLAEEQLSLLDRPRARVNVSPLRALNDLEGALHHLQRALEQWLTTRTLVDDALLQSIGRLRPEGLTATIQFHLTLMNFAVARLSINSLDRKAQQLLLAGAGIEPFSWADCSFFARLWRGQHVEELVLWHDQGYGDAIQNLAWIEINQRGSIATFCTASLLRVVQQRMSSRTAKSK